ncbi:peptide-methionine (S)-S-oxide reductase MsrA [Lentibacillus saliphilus]|uniref:peptide-methionine (S)-S-oxide reductase MsrA n=1 Tax=Lentibacillus saliphilus TaxID=2737028 RepID=UPI001C3037F3|nr:peptide-methionine (S)-S-oxide reductase MsrA [Lentibacillus saliphilus]
MAFKKTYVAITLLILTLSACSFPQNHEPVKHQQVTNNTASQQDGYVLKGDVRNINDHLDWTNIELNTIYFAGGCFWGVEAFMARIYGVYDVTSGYANGEGVNPKYEDVVIGKGKFAETVRIKYDPQRVSLESLINKLFLVIDPTSVNQQGNDIGVQYRTGIYYEEQADASVIETVIHEQQKQYDDDIVTEAKPLKNFYRAEDEHQDYLEKNPNGYCHINLSILNTFTIDPISKDKAIVQSLSK